LTESEFWSVPAANPAGYFDFFLIQI